MKQLRNLRNGIAGERDAAHYIDNHYKDRSTHAVIHDLRIQVGGEIAQIDHLIISRGMHFYLLETKSFNGNLVINDHGEFSVKYANAAVFGIPSPLEQSRRHANVLARLLTELKIKNRTGNAFQFHNIVLVHPKAGISRPAQFDTSQVIKADSFATWHEKFQNKLTFLQAISAIFDMRKVQSLKETAEKLAQRHQPSDPLELPEFMALTIPTRSPTQGARQVIEPLPQLSLSDASRVDQKKRLTCSTCGVKITYPEGQFCWNNERRFGGKQYCRTHQRAFT